jgi:hypothetical protein
MRAAAPQRLPRELPLREKSVMARREADRFWCCGSGMRRASYGGNPVHLWFRRQDQYSKRE